MGRSRRWFWIALLVAGGAAACGAIEGLDTYDNCGSHCSETDATTKTDVGSGSSSGSSGGTSSGSSSGQNETPDAGDATEIGEEPDGADIDDGGPDDAVADVPIVDGTGFDVVATDAPVVDGTVPTCTQTPNLSTGVFVAPEGADVEGGQCGNSPLVPCKTIGAALATAVSTGATIVYVAAGTYTEVVTLPPGIDVQGGWHFGADSGGAWTYDCSGHPESVVTLQAPASSNQTVVAKNVGGTATLTAVTVLSMPPQDVQAGKSLYGIYATGSTTTLVLNDVVVQVAPAGNGKTGSAGSNGSTSSSCSTAGSGNSGTTGPAGAAGPAGTFSANGYATDAGSTGTKGGSGANGAAGQSGQSQNANTCSMQMFGCNNGSTSCVGGTGTPGCGGTGGNAGTGGGGGGSSVALYASAGATVTVNGGSYSAGNGGNGGAGGNGGTGGSGGNGAAGSRTTCPQSMCQGFLPPMCMSGNNVVSDGGAPGGMGGAGGQGGAGGGGSGGDSYAIVTVSATTNLNGGPALAHGNAGTSGGSGAPAGTSGNTGMF